MRVLTLHDYVSCLPNGLTPTSRRRAREGKTLLHALTTSAYSEADDTDGARPVTIDDEFIALVGYARSTVVRALASLAKRGWVIRDDVRTYRICVDQIRVDGAAAERERES